MMNLAKHHTLGLWWALIALCTALVLHSGGLLQATTTSAPGAATSTAGPTPGLTLDHASFVDEYLEVADEIDPALAEQLRSMCQLDPAHFGQVLRQLGPVLSQLVELRQTDPKLFRRKIQELHLEAAIESLAASIRIARARGESVDPTQDAQLRALVESQLAASFRTRQQVLKRMRAELNQAEVELAREKKDFGGEVSRRIHRLRTQ